MSEAQRSLLRERIRSWLIVEKSPRRDMVVIIALSGAAAFLSSVALLALGVEALTLRYPLAAVIAYAVFLLCLRIWVLWREPRARSDGGFDLPLEFPQELVRHPDASVEAFQGFGGGGGFSGAGASGSIERTAAQSLSPVRVASQPADHFDVDWDAEGLIVLPLVVAAVILGGAALYAVIVAPVLFAELVVDALVVAGVYRRMRRLPARHWFISSLAHTWRPFAMLFVVTIIASMILQSAAPSADSIGDVFRSND